MPIYDPTATAEALQQTAAPAQLEPPPPPPDNLAAFILRAPFWSLVQAACYLWLALLPMIAITRLLAWLTDTGGAVLH